MKNIFCIVFCFTLFQTYAQIGINTTDPKSTLDIRSSSQSSPSATDGILIPKVDLFPTTNPTMEQDAMLVYLTTTDGTDAPGFYYWNNDTTAWLPIVKGIEKINELTDGKSDDDGSNNGSSIFLGVDAGTNDDSNNRRNVGVGYQALQTNSSGRQNVGIGYQSLNANTTAFANTGVGYHALNTNTTGNANVGVGYRTLTNNLTGRDNVAIGYETLASNISGNQSTGVGTQTLRANTASGNVGMGYFALRTNTTGVANVGVGHRALQNNISGGYNVSVGSSALVQNTTGSFNSALGAVSLISNTSGTGNTGVGGRSLSANTEGDNNTAVGFASMYRNTTGTLNTASGGNTLSNNTEGSQNTVYGYDALSFNTVGNDNIAVGYRALRRTTGSNNIGIGTSVSPSADTVSNEVTLGNSNNNVYRMYASTWTTISDRNLKHGIKDIPVGLDFVSKLKPVEFIYNNAKEEQKTYGFIAQEVKEALKDSQIKDEVIVVDFDENYIGMKQTELIPVLTKAIQEQQSQIEDQQRQINELKNIINTVLEAKE